ncbi:MAG: glycosyltransferase family 4 protein [Massilia sp.]|nr:MAG: glycosyltransferase family 4 protein [Massilia sp.]
MRILTFSTLFPNAAKPHHGIFTETTLRHQLATGEIQAKVVAPIPWFPFPSQRFGEYGTFAMAPFKEVRVGTEVFHPRYPVIPKLGANLTPLGLALAARAVIGRLLDDGFDFDVIDAHYFYPDGVAAVLLGKYFNRPVIISALGTDINLIMQQRLPRRMIRWAGERAAAMITVCDALRNEMMRHGMDPARITTLRNGVDLDLFKQVDRKAARDSLGFQHFTLLSVGHLDPRKGHAHVISALPSIPDAHLVIVGTGQDHKRLLALAHVQGVADRVVFAGAMTQEQLCIYYSAADALVLASSREGWANVLLEAMACGTRVIASNVWGTPEVVREPVAGVLMVNNSAQGVIDSVRELRSHSPQPGATRAYAEQFSWEDTTRGQLRLFRQAARPAHPANALQPVPVSASSRQGLDH